MQQEIKAKQVNRIKILLAGMLTFAAGGISYAWSIIQPFVMKQYHIDASAASAPFSVNLGVFVVGCILGGRLQLKFSVQKSLFIGVMVSFLGILSSAAVPVGAPWLLTITFGAVSGIGGGITYNTLIAAMQKYFPDKKGMATGFILCMIGVSGFYMSPFIDFVLTNYSLTAMFLIVAAVTLVAGIIGSLVIKDPPEGYMADYRPADVKIFSTSKQYAPKEMLKTKSFYLISLSMFLAVPGFMLINPQFVVLSQQRNITPSQALTAVMLASVLQAAGRLLIPTISDKAGRKLTLVFIFILSSAVIGALVIAKGLAYPILFITLAFLYGGYLGTYPALSTDYFGTKNAGINYALVMTGFGIASLLCPVLVRAVKSTSLGTPMSFAIAGIATILGLILLLKLKKPSV